VSAASLRNRVYPVWEASASWSSRPLEGNPFPGAWSQRHKGQPDKFSSKPRCGGGQPKCAGQPVATGGQCSQPDKVGTPEASGDWHEPWQRGEPVRLSHRPVGHPAIAASLQPAGVGTTRQLVRGEPGHPRSTRHGSALSTRAAKVGITRCPSAWWAGEQPDGRGANPQVTAQGEEPAVVRSTHPAKATRAEPPRGRSTHALRATREEPVEMRTTHHGSATGAEPHHARSTHAKGATRAEPIRARSTQVEEAIHPEPSLQRPTRAVVAPLAQPVFPRPTHPEGARGEPSRTRSTQSAEATRPEPSRLRSTQHCKARRGEPSVTRATRVRRRIGAKPLRRRSTRFSPATPHQPSSLGEPIRSGLHALSQKPFRFRSTQSEKATRAEPSRLRSTDAEGATRAQPELPRCTQSLWRQAFGATHHKVNPSSRSTASGAKSKRATLRSWHGAQSLAGAGLPARKSHASAGQPIAAQPRIQSQMRTGQPSRAKSPASYGRPTHVIGSHGGNYG
jgi:hypothetical protein